MDAEAKIARKDQGELVRLQIAVRAFLKEWSDGVPTQEMRDSIERLGKLVHYR